MTDHCQPASHLMAHRSPVELERERCATLCESMAAECADRNQVRCACVLGEAARLIRKTGEEE